ncbi:MAG: ABC transporter ATP-binding protein [Spirochaetales bacterium]|nr:ABC transporter ATP-binding protein [Spirochaetales bacterium]
MKVFHFLIGYTKRYWPALVTTMASMALLVGVQLLAPWLIRTMIALVTGKLADDTLHQIDLLALLALAVFTGKGFLFFLRSYMAHVAGWGVVADVRSYVYRHLQQLSLRFYDNKQTGQLMSRVVNDSDKLETLIAHAIPDVVVNILMFFGIGAVLLALNWQLMLFCLIPVPLIVLGMRGFGKYVRPAFRKRQEELGELNAALNDNLSGIREIKAFAQEEREAERIDQSIQNYKGALLKALKLMATFHPLIEFASSTGIIVLIYFGSRFVLNHFLPIADLVAFFLYLELFYQPVRLLSNVWEQVQEAYAGAERLAELLNEIPEVQEKPHSIRLTSRARGHIVFNNVSFSYIDDVPVLDHINLDIPAGKSAALVGPTGVGKTTLASLIPRFYDVTEGSITLDDTDLRDISIKSLRSQVSLVLQDVFLFYGSVKDNILFSRPEATDEEMIAAATVANAHQFISGLPEGYDTIIGERGVKLSGGQKQRLSIARAVLADAPVLILDEATSSVDTETEMLIQQALEKLMKGRTTIIIAHRLSTIRKADMIVVLKEGKITESGTHEELLSNGGTYWQLHDVLN